jgi:predicted transcriptional regulator
MNLTTTECRQAPRISVTGFGAWAARTPAPPILRMDDSAVQLVDSSSSDVLWAIRDGCGLDEVLGKMSRLRVSAFLVIRGHQVVGLLTCEDIQRRRDRASIDNRVADVMTEAVHVPMVGWDTVLAATVSDLLQIFDSTRSNHLMVVESERTDFTRVRGLIYRRQLMRQLGVFPILDRGMELALAPMAGIQPSRIPVPSISVVCPMIRATI